MKYYLLFFALTLFVAATEKLTAGGDPLKDFDRWELQYFDQTYVNCSETQVSLYDDFTGNALSENWQTHLYGPKEDGLYCRLHTNDAEQIFTTDNVRVENGLLKLTARWEDVQWKGVQRNISSGMVQSKNGFNLGKYEIRCKMPQQAHVWTAFWVWSIEEIDIIDVATRKYYSNAMHGNGYSQSQPERNLAVDLSDDFHTYTCEWTPFKVDYFFDGKKTATFYRYYKPDKTPLDVNCGDEIPQGVYKLNPAFPILSRQFKPIAWIAIEKACWHGDCDCDDDQNPHTHCGPKIEKKDLPATFEVDYIKVEEKSYDLLSITPACFFAEHGNNTRNLLDLSLTSYNGKHSKNSYDLTHWDLSKNVNILSQQGNKIHFNYEKPLQKSGTYSHWIVKNDIVTDRWELPLITLESAFLVTTNIKNQEKLITLSTKQYACFTEKGGLIDSRVWKFIKAMIF